MCDVERKYIRTMAPSRDIMQHDDAVDQMFAAVVCNVGAQETECASCQDGDCCMQQVRTRRSMSDVQNIGVPLLMSIYRPWYMDVSHGM